MFRDFGLQIGNRALAEVVIFYTKPHERTRLARRMP